MGSAGSEGGPCIAFRVVIEHEPGAAPTVHDMVAALQGHTDGLPQACYIEVHPAPGSACEETGCLWGPNGRCPRCNVEVKPRG